MNKKNLSVVLAGAMLATSVAPVLAATEKEYSLDDKALLTKDIVSTMKTKMLTENSMLKGDTNAVFVSKDVKDILNEDNQSAFGIRILDEKGKKVDLNSLDNSAFATPKTYITYDTEKVDDALENIKEGYSVELVERETTEFYGELIPGTKIEKGTEVLSYSNDDLSSAAIASGGTGKTYNEIVLGTVGSLPTNNVLLATSDTLKTEVVDGKNVVTVNTNTPKDLSNPTGDKVKIVLKEKDQKIDGRLPLSEDGKLLDTTKAEDIAKFNKFDTLTSWTASEKSTTEPTVTATYKMTAAAKEENTVKAEELYDGVVLTAKGTELAAELANAKENAASADEALVKIGTVTKGAVNKFSIYYYKNSDLASKDTTNVDGKDQDNSGAVVAYKSITVYSSNADEIDALYALLDPTPGTASYKVGIVGGANRYATAVNIAKESGANLNVVDADNNGVLGSNELFNNNIVLVNGDSLVDGLSAAPLAATLNEASGSEAKNLKKAPVLLSKSDSLPTETKEYIASLLPSGIKAKKQIVVTLVGGKSVLTNSLVKELEEMGVTVRRLGGDNREATSLVVAKEIKSAGNANAAFVVGGNGEADAMAISAVAAKTTTPIIVSSVHGISEDALEYLKENSAKGDVTIVGGKSVVSETEEEAINEALTLNKVSRIAGENRFATNAAIIKEYYGNGKTMATRGVENVVLAKDGQADKKELVDALAAANFAAENDAPIVLATNSLNAIQKNELLKVKAAKTKKLVQVGQGVERPVLDSLASLLGLSNK